MSDLEIEEVKPEAIPEIPLGYRRADGTAVGLINGMAYHFTSDSPYWSDVEGRIAVLPLQEALPDGRKLPEYVDGKLVTDAAKLPPLDVPVLTASQPSGETFSADALRAGFKAMGMSQAKIDAFFAAAAKLDEPQD